MIKNEPAKSVRQLSKRPNNEALWITVGPASKEVPESAIAAQPPAQYPELLIPLLKYSRHWKGHTSWFVTNKHITHVKLSIRKDK